MNTPFFTRAQLGAIMISLFIGISFGLYYFFKPPEKLNILLREPNGSYLSNQDIKINWIFEKYDGKVNIFFVSPKNQMIDTIALAIDNDSKRENEFIWKTEDLKKLTKIESKIGHIIIENKTLKVKSKTQITINRPIEPPIFVPSKKNFELQPDFNGKELSLLAIDSDTNSQSPILKGLIFDKSNKVFLGKTTTSEIPNKINVEKYITHKPYKNHEFDGVIGIMVQNENSFPFVNPISRYEERPCKKTITTFITEGEFTVRIEEGEFKSQKYEALHIEPQLDNQPNCRCNVDLAELVEKDYDDYKKKNNLTEVIFKFNPFILKNIKMRRMPHFENIKNIKK